jgi:hypothetical protein
MQKNAAAGAMFFLHSLFLKPHERDSKRLKNKMLLAVVGGAEN